MPALPLDEAGKYVAGAYLVFLSLLLIYIAIMAVRLQRIERTLADFVRREDNESESDSVRGFAPDPSGAAAKPPRGN